MKNNDDFINELKKNFNDMFESDDSVSDSITNDENLSDLDNIVVLNDEDGNEHEFEFLDLIEYKGENYVVLLPKDDEADEVVILKLAESDNEDEESYVSVEDERTLNIIFEIFKEKFKDYFDFVD